MVINAIKSRSLQERISYMSTKRFFVLVTGIALVNMGLFPSASLGQLAKGANKFLGNITTNGQVRSDFITYWDQITGENEHKWASVEGERDKMNWGGADRIVNYAKEHNIPWKFHTLIWGSQYPSWMDRLSTNEQKEEIIEWYDAAAARYPDVDMIDVVNEAYMSNPNNWNAGKHAPIPFRDALGGTGATGFDWIVTAFKMARERWPKAILIYNDYNTLEWGNEINWIKQIIPKLVAAGAPIDAVGFQAHGLKGTSAATLKSRLDDIYNSIKLPMLISEYDIGDVNDQVQLDNYKAHITEMWNHPKVAGITIWGYIYGSTWVTGTGIINNGKERPAMTWLKEFITANPNPPNDYPNLLSGAGSNYTLSVITRGQGAVTSSSDKNSFEKDSKVTLTATPSEGWIFDSWSGDERGNQNPLQITMSATKSITANFKTKDGKQDFVLNGNFSAETNSWTFNNWGGTGSGTVENGEYKITVNEVGDNDYDLQAVQPGILLEIGKAYRLEFEARASANRKLTVNVGMPVSPYTTFLNDIINGEKEITLTTAKQKFSIDFKMSEPSYDNSRVEFSAGLNTSTVYIDNVSLYEIEPNSVTMSKRAIKTNAFVIRQSGSLLNLTFNAPGNRKASLDIYDLNGNVVKSAIFKTQAGNAQNLSFNTKDMSSGYYVVKVKCENTLHKTGLVISGR